MIFPPRYAEAIEAVEAFNEKEYLNHGTMNGVAMPEGT